MKNEMPPSRTSAPIAIAATLPPLSPLLPVVDEVGVMIVGVVAVGMVADGCGRTGESGFAGPGLTRFGVEPWATATEGATTTAPGTTIAAITAAAANGPRTS
jgi:hypothetical protein